MFKKKLSLLLPACLALAISGCTTVGPDHTIPEAAKVNDPGAKTDFVSLEPGVAVRDNVPEKWWELYQDKDLNRLVEKALKNNTDLRVAAANLEWSQGVLEEVRMGRIPKVDVTANPHFGRNISGNNGSKNPRYPDRWINDGGINISYQLDIWGKITRAIESAEAYSESFKAAEDVTRITVAAETARAYTNACSSAWRRDIAIRTAKLQKDFLNTTEALYRAGRATEMEVARARAQNEAMAAAVFPLEAQRKLALYRLAVLTGEVPGNIDPAADRCNRVPLLKQPIPVGDGAQLLRRRPDIRAAERMMASASADIGVATADLYPNISLGLSAGMGGFFSQFGDTNTFRWGIGPLISWTIPGTSTARARIKQAEALHKREFANFDGVVLDALRETESALTTYARELDRNAALKRARDESAKANAHASKLYYHGRIDFMGRLDSERTYALDEAAYASSAAKLADDQISVFLALGGGWRQDSESLVAPAPDQLKKTEVASDAKTETKTEAKADAKAEANVAESAQAAAEPAAE